MKSTFLLLSTLLIASGVSAKTITLDVGHFLEKPGAISAFGETELMYNQMMSVNLYETISALDYKVKVQGYDGKLKSLSQRAAQAKGSDFFISIHHDSVQEYDLQPWEFNGTMQRFTNKAQGFSVFVSEDNPHYEKSRKCAVNIANGIASAGFPPNYYHHHHNPKGNFKLLYKDLPVYNFNKLVVLKTNKIPAILIEAGVILNPVEANALKDNNVRTRFAIGVAAGLRKCLE